MSRHSAGRRSRAGGCAATAPTDGCCGLRSPTGRGWYGIGTDITRRRQVEWELRTSNAQLSAIVENTGTAIYVKRKGDFRYLLANPEFERLLGIEAGTGVGLRDEDVLSPEAVELVRRADYRVLEEGIEISHEEEVPVGGVLLTYATRKFPLRDETGEPYAVCGISTDITESRRREVELAERVRWGKRIRAAVNEGKLLVYAQPIIDLTSGAVVQEELLVRLRSEEYMAPVLPPADFLPAAERFGLVGEIDRYMVRRGIELAAGGRAVEINLSGQSIGDQALTREIERELRAERGGSVTGGVRDHRDGGGPGHRCGARVLHPDRAPGLPVRPGRLRHRLRVADLPAPAGGAVPEDRHLVRRRAHRK